MGFPWYIIVTFCLAVFLIMFKPWRLFSELKRTNDKKSFPNNKDTKEPSAVRLTISYIKQFKPSWRSKNGKLVLEGGENGNNANLAVYLRNNGLEVETEEILPNGSRTDLIINDQIVIECKPQLINTDTLHKLVGEVKRARKISKYDALALIYGDARKDLHGELCDEIGEDNVIVLGNLT